MEIKNLTYKEELKKINYTFTHKKIYGIIGNKQDSTLLLELIRGLKKPTSGSIEKDNLRAFMLFESSEDQIFGDTIKEEITYGLDENSIDLEEISKKVGLDDDFWNKKPINLSSGEKRKLVIASMLAFNPDIVLVDNFLNSLDFETQKMFINLLKRMQFDDHKIIIIADQNTKLLYELVDEVILLNGEILLSGNKYDVFKNVDLLDELDVEIPEYIEFTNLVARRKSVDLPYRDRITDIVKDVYDNV